MHNITLLYSLDKPWLNGNDSWPSNIIRPNILKIFLKLTTWSLPQVNNIGNSTFLHKIQTLSIKILLLKEINQNNHFTHITTHHRLGCLWSHNWGTIAVEVLMLMLVQVLVMMLMTFIMHELWCTQPRGNSVCVGLQETIVQFMAQKFRTCMK